MKKTFTVVIACCFAFFAGGWAGVLFGWLSQSVYLTIASLVGTFASVAGLLALSRPSISRSDLQELELDNLLRLAQSTAKLDELESKKLRTQSDIAELTRTRAEMDSLVRKAATILFLREELLRLEERIEAHVAKSPEVQGDLRLYEDKKEKLLALNEEVKTHKDADLLAEIIARVSVRPEGQIEIMYKTLDQIWIIGPILKIFLQIELLQRDRRRLSRYQELSAKKTTLSNDSMPK